MVVYERHEAAAGAPCDPVIPGELRRGRGAPTNIEGRFERHKHVRWDDGWESLGTLEGLRTTVTIENPRKIITRNKSPDIPFDRSINPYRGCEHGCIYCFARPTHAYLGLSPGLDFESRLFAKPDAHKLLERELRAPGYRVATIAMGTNTDPYQPIEKEWRITRRILQVLDRFENPVAIVTKSALITRDLDILKRMAARDHVSVFLSVTTLDRRLARIMEPRAATPARRLETISALAAAGIPTGVMIAPVIPAINDAEIEAILAAARDAGADRAGYIPLRLPLEVRDLFRAWLDEHFPDRKERVMSIVRDMRGGRENDPRFGSRMRGQGPHADLLRRRFRVACDRRGLNANGRPQYLKDVDRRDLPDHQLSLF